MAVLCQFGHVVQIGALTPESVVSSQTTRLAVQHVCYYRRYSV